MAKADFKLPEDFLLQISRLNEQTDVVLPRVLEAGGEVAEKAFRASLSGAIGRNIKGKRKSTGRLLEALGVTPAKLDRDGNYNVKVGFSEPRVGGGSNAKIANILEYGRSDQPARPFLKQAKSTARKPCIDAMKTKLEEELKRI